jgi:hypothetical protein
MAKTRPLSLHRSGQVSYCHGLHEPIRWRARKWNRTSIQHHVPRLRSTLTRFGQRSTRIPPRLRPPRLFHVYCESHHTGDKNPFVVFLYGSQTRNKTFHICYSRFKKPGDRPLGPSPGGRRNSLSLPWDHQPQHSNYEQA